MGVKQKQVFFDEYKNLTEAKNDILNLNQLSSGRRGKIIKVPNNNLLAALGVRKGKIIKIENIQPLGGPIVIEIDGRSIAIGRGTAKQIKVGSLSNVN